MIKRGIQRLIGWEALSEREKYLKRYQILGWVSNAISWLPISLPWLFRWFGSDKQQPGWHSYGLTYQDLFRPWKYRRIKMLEIGIGGYGESLGGASLLAWQAFFPLGTVYGADIEDKAALASGRRRVLRLDQSSSEQLSALRQDEGPFDIIVDDGSHLNAHQILTFEYLFDALSENGLYVIEDIQTSFWPGQIAGVTWDGLSFNDPRFLETCYGYFLELSKYLNQAEFPERGAMNATMAMTALSIRQIAFEHNLIIIRKGGNRDRSAFIDQTVSQIIG